MNKELEKKGAYKRILYTIKSHGDKKRYKVDLILYRQEGKLRMLMVNKKCTLKALECIMLYKKRVSIETPYRMKHLAKAWTTSKKPVLRTVLFGMSCLLYFWAIYREVIANSKQTITFEGKVKKHPYEMRMRILLALIRF